MLKIGNYELKTLIVKLVQTNCYVLSLNKDCILVDAAGDGSEILQYIKSNSLNLRAILITHGHYDHIEALDLLHKEFPNVKIYASSAEKEVIEDKTKSLMDHELDSATQNAISYIVDGSIINALDLDIKFITLVDLDNGRKTGGISKITYIKGQLKKIGQL